MSIRKSNSKKGKNSGNIPKTIVSKRKKILSKSELLDKKLETRLRRFSTHRDNLLSLVDKMEIIHSEFEGLSNEESEADLNFTLYDEIEFFNEEYDKDSFNTIRKGIEDEHDNIRSSIIEEYATHQSYIQEAENELKEMLAEIEEYEEDEIDEKRLEITELIKERDSMLDLTD